VDGVRLDGDLCVPAGARGVVLFAHGSGSSRRSPRNRLVAAALQRAGLGTLLFDLLQPEEADGADRRFDIELLAERLSGAMTWVRSHPSLRTLRIGLFGASTGAAAALVAAARAPHVVSAVVSRGGRPDLAGAHLPHVQAPTLLIVGGADPVVLGLNEEARRSIGGRCDLVVIPGATHLFEEPGALEEVARLAAGWFAEHVGAGRDGARS
jgi:putative phosphoribosyl transferase